MPYPASTEPPASHDCPIQQCSYVLQSHAYFACAALTKSILTFYIRTHVGGLDARANQAKCCAAVTVMQQQITKSVCDGLHKCVWRVAGAGLTAGN